MFRFAKDRLLLAGLRVGGALAAAVLLLIVLFLSLEAFPALRRVGLSRFLLDESWHPAPAASAGTFGMTPMLAGTVFVTVGAMFLALPVGLFCAVAIHFYLPRRLAGGLRVVIELLAGIPSVVYGFWGLVVLVPLIGRLQPPGASLLAGALILALMILPLMALTADAAFTGLPRELRHASAVLGLSRPAQLWGVFIPSVRKSLMTGAMLQTGRALGETMAVIMVCGNIVQVPDSLFDPVRTLTANIALEMAYALGDHRASLFVSGLALMLIVAGMVTVAGALNRGTSHGRL